jgi:predicted O-methyltransferase YrrM
MRPEFADVRAQIRSTLDAIYASGEVFDEAGYSCKIWPIAVTREAGEFLRDLVLRERPTRTLEVGLGLGLSALWIVDGLLGAAHGGGDTDAPPRHTIIEPAAHVFGNSGKQTLRRAGVEPWITLHEASSQHRLASMSEQGEQFDLAYIDGGHRFDEVLIDLYFAQRVVRPGGLIVLDDHWMPAVQAALAFMHTNLGLTFELFDPQGPGRRYVALRSPQAGDARSWDHFVEFSRATLPEYPWRRIAG